MSINPKPKPVKALKVRKGLSNKPTTRKAMANKIHEVIRAIVLDRDGHCSCIIAPEKGHSPIRQAGHVITASKWNTRFDLRNVHEQCKSCNSRHENFPHYYIDWFTETFGKEAWHSLCQDAEKTKKLQLYELQELLEQMRKIRQRQLVEALAGNPWKPRFTQAEILSGAWSK